MMIDYTKEPFCEWFQVAGITFFRKLENETAFDGVVKIYSLKTDRDEINQKLKGLFFHDFWHTTSSGVLLRQYNNINSWPKTKLVHLNWQTRKLQLIQKTNSSYNVWPVVELPDGALEVEITPDEKVVFPANRGRAKFP